MNLLPQHRKCIVVAVLLLLSTAIAHWFLVRPLKKRFAENQATLDKKEQRLSRTGWPLDKDLLSAELERLQKRLKGSGGKLGIEEESRLVISKSTSMFDQKIREFCGDPAAFTRRASRLDFQAEFNRVQQKLAENGIFVGSPVLNLAEDSTLPYNYQLLLQVWTLEKMADLAIKNGLKAVTLKNTKIKIKEYSGSVADFRVLPPRAYVISDDDSAPYLLEFPISANFIGTPMQNKSFLTELTAGGNFLPAGRIEVFADDPAKDGYQQGQEVKVDRVRAHFECSSFYLISGKKKAATKKNGASPQGA